MQTQIKKWGNSQGIRIPKQILQKLDLKTSDLIDLSIEKDKLIIKKSKNHKRKSIVELFANYEGEYKTQEIDWGEPMGDEIW